MDENEPVDTHPLIKRANENDVNQIGGFAAAAKSMKVVELCQWYRDEIAAAPKRALNGKKPYFVSHSGKHDREHFGAGSKGNGEGRKEEHLASALFNDYGHASQGLAIGGGGLIHILDYQFPLKAKSGDKEVGKIDLLALTSVDQLAVVELKYMPVSATISGADTPLRAFLEGLAYCAFLRADFECIREEAVKEYNRPIANKPPALIVLANDYYWKLFLEYKDAAVWTMELQRLADGVEEALKIPVSFLSLSISDEPVRYEDQRPKFIKPPLLKRAW